ncbi:flavocytochrome c [uncultured Parasutterella sp.]|uniref:FAD-dependent oxidoreductase n=1 Tax=uncultured Parasutterella sp. TaxID=1263098 RepID=UPI0025E56ACE|nr:flavocytochrome c [uncultured Parasutterella sp.]
MLRRDFISLVATAISSPCSANAITSRSEEFDLIVVGSGAAGLSAAISASDAGLKNILILEKLPIIGGTSANSGGAVAVSGTKMQKKFGIYDSDKQFFEDLMREGGYLNNPLLVRTYIEEIRKQYEWMSSCGVSPSTLMAAAGMSTPRSHMFNSHQLMRFFLEETTKRGILIKAGTRAVDLLVQNGCIRGVSTVKGKRNRILTSRHGVVLATGGFARNQALMNIFAPQMFGVDVVSGIGSDGDGHLMALGLGGCFVPEETVTASFGFAQKPSRVKDFSTIFYSGAIILNRSGERFVDESLPYKSLGEAFLRTKESCAYIVFDENIRKLQMSRRPVDQAMWSPYDKGLEPSYCHRGKTIKEAADKAGLNPMKVVAQVEKYNSYVVKGEDPDFGRKSLSSGYGKPLPICIAPFYIMPAIAVVPGTYCGIKIDEKARVVKSDGEPIKGLYAAGEIIGGFHGKNFVTGTGLGKALAFGRVAGRTAAL